jgi:dephospho-CoA kinase
MSTRRRRPAAGDGLWIVGLVGRTGSGKSTVAQALAAHGAAVIEGDQLGHQVTDQDPEVRAALIAEYGPAVYRPDGTLDRRAVAARVFSDPEARGRLDRLVHPRIIERIRAGLDRLRADGFRGPVVIDAALLLDWGLESWCDAVVAVVAPAAEQVTRLSRSRGWSEREARLRLGAQQSNEAFAAAADQVLDNRGTRPELEQAARRMMARWPNGPPPRAEARGRESC